MIKMPWRIGDIPNRSEVVTLEHIEHEAVVGVISGMTDGDITYLMDLLVLEPYRGQGIGTGLVHRFLEERHVKGTIVVLITAEATEFYRKFGFVERTAMVRKPTA